MNENDPTLSYKLELLPELLETRLALCELAQSINQSPETQFS